MGLGFLLPHGEWITFVSELYKGTHLLEHAGVVSLSSHAGTGRYNQSSAALVPGPPALGIGSWLSFWSRIGFLPVEAGYIVPAFVFHAFSVTHGNG